jgi:hypothetical protein
VSRSARGEKWQNVAGSQSPSDALGVVGTIAEHAVGTTPGSSSFALQRRDRIDKRQRFLRIVPVGAGQAHRQWRALPVADQMALAPAFGPVGRIRTGLPSTIHCPHGAAIDNSPRPTNLIVTREPIEQRKVHQVPSAGRLPVAQASPACHSGPTAHFARQHLPRDAAAKDKENTAEARSIREARPSTLRSLYWNWKEWFDKIPQRIRKQRDGHNSSHYLTASG